MKKLAATLLLALTGSLFLGAQALSVSVVSTVNVICNAACNGSITVAATGGTAPYTYLWMPGAYTTPTINNLCAGAYTCTVTDAASATATVVATITQPTAITATMSATAPTTCSSCNGAAIATVSGGSGPYSYCWNGCVFTASTYSPVCSGTYNLLVTDANGCILQTTVAVNNPASPTVTITPSSTTICAGSSVTLNASGAMSYVWMPGNLTGCCPVVTPTVTTTYTVVGTAANGCTASAALTIVVSPLPVVTISGQNPTCNNADGSATATASGTGPFAYSWVPVGGNTATATGLSVGTYTCTVIDAMGCVQYSTIFLSDSCDYVWPGDANDDAIADNIDILDIGIANGATGTTRANATTAWIGQPSTAWGTTLLSGTDYKWVDCDGNGVIDPIDTQAVVLNYGLTHNNRLAAPQNSAVATDVSISFDQDSVGGGNTGTLTLSLGSSTNPANGVYGLAFRLNYDAAQIATSSIGFIGGSTWFGTPGSDQMRVVLHPNAANGYVDVAITRLDHQNVSGSGPIAQIYFTATTALNGTGNTALVPMTITNVVLIDNAEALQTTNAVGDTVSVCDDALITNVNQHANTATALYPNPANETLQFTVSGSGQQLVTIEDVTGKVVYSQYHTAGLTSISVASLPAGAYVLRVSGNDTHTTNHFTVAH